MIKAKPLLLLLLYLAIFLSAQEACHWRKEEGLEKEAKFYSVVCRVATILKTRYTSPGFWNDGLRLFQEAEQMVKDGSKKKHLKSCITQAQEQLGEVENGSEELRDTQNRTNRGANISFSPKY